MLRKHYQPLSDGTSSKDAALQLRTAGLKIMIGKPISEFEAVFDAAYDFQTIREPTPENQWEASEALKNWADKSSTSDHSAIYYLETNIWKTVDLMTEKDVVDELLICVDDGVIMDFKFFANYLY
ncbi:MAG: hypothetical protein AAFX06_19855 [Planctomycetota bacterium]